MTTKRFEMGYDDGLLRFVKDNVTNTNLDIVDCWTVLNELNDKNEQLASELVECKALIMMLSDTTVSGRVDNLIYSRYNFYSEDEYYKKLEEYKNKVIKELEE